MPVVRRKERFQGHPDHEALLEELTTHLRQEAPEGTLAQPLIVEEEIRGSSRFRIYVLWDRWNSVKDEERSQIILEAYQNAYGSEKMLNASLALGVTSLEATQLGISFY